MRLTHRLLTTAVLFGLLLIPTQVALAANITVNSNADTVSSGDNECTLPEAINNANNGGGGDTTGGDCDPGVAGSDTILFDLANPTIDMDVAFGVDITEDIVIDGTNTGAGQIVLNSSGISRFLQSTGGDDITLQNLTIQNFGSPTPTSQSAFGSAMFVVGGTLTIDNVDFIDNDINTVVGTGAAGGAIYAENVTANITNSSFTGNSVIALSGNVLGGAIYAFESDLTISDSAFSNNQATSTATSDEWNAIGGAIFVEDGTLTLDTVTFSGNSVTSSSNTNEFNGDALGGAIFVDSLATNVNGFTLEIANSAFTSNSAMTGTCNSASMCDGYTAGGAIDMVSGDASITDTSFTSNSVTGGDNLGTGESTFADGGTIFASSTGLTITGSTFTSNSASSDSPLVNDLNDGGAIFNDNTIDLIDDTTFTSNSTTNDGGAIFSWWTITTISNSTFTDNYAGDDGGALLMEDSDGPTTIDNTVFDSNDAADSGGGIYIDCGCLDVDLINGTQITNNTAGDDGGGVVVNNGATASFSDVTISGNTAGDQGGGLRVEDDAFVSSITNTTFAENEADAGGGISVILADIGDISFSTFFMNEALAGGGGAIQLDGLAFIDLIEFSTIDHNSASTVGGGIRVLNQSTVTTIDSSTISNNTAGSDGGGIQGQTSNTAFGTLLNSTISGNVVGSGGGGIHLDGASAGDILNSTIAGNTGVGLNVDSGTLATLNNSIIAGHGASADCLLGGSGSISSATNNLDSDGTCPNTLGTNPITPGVDYDTTLANNGGPTLTHALLAGSKAIDQSSGGEADDQRTAAAFGTRDVGAYEYGYEPLVASLYCDDMDLVIDVTSGAPLLTAAVSYPNGSGQLVALANPPSSTTESSAEYGTWSVFISDGNNIEWYFDDVTCSPPSGGGGGGDTGGNLVVSDPALSKTGLPENATVGEPVTWLIVVTNTGTTQQDNVVITDDVPDQFDIVSASATQGTVDVNGQLITANLGTLLGSGTATITINTVANDSALPGSVCNTAYWDTTPATDCVTFFPDALPPTGGPSPLVATLRTLIPLMALLGMAGVGGYAWMRRRSIQ